MPANIDRHIERAPTSPRRNALQVRSDSAPLVIHRVTGAQPGFDRMFDTLWDLQVPDATVARRLQATTLPSAGLHVVFCYGDELGISDDGRHWVPLRSHISGPILDAHRVRVDGAAGVLAVHLSAAASRGFVGGPMRAFAHRRTALADVLPAGQVHDIEARLRRCDDATGRSALAQAWVARWIEPASPLDGLEQAVRRLRGDGEVRIAALAGELGLTERTLQRQFAHHCGVSPKQLALSVRLRRAVQLSRGPASWTQIAHLCGFSDQAHLVRSFVAVFGQSPGQFRALHGDARLQPPVGPVDGQPGDTALSLSAAVDVGGLPAALATAHASSDS